MPSFSNSTITLTTDFGLEDPYVGTMKGVILSVNPRATVVDLSHGIPSHDVMAGALALRTSYEYFPAQAIHVAVVDPGVGSRRRPILVLTSKCAFVGPDNGLFSFVLLRERPIGVIHLTEERYFRLPLSQTFHGRDIFAPVAAYLSLGTPPKRFGPLIKDFATLAWPAPRRLADGTIRAEVLRVDKFGNLITNISADDLALSEVSESGLVIRLGEHRITRVLRSYAEAAPGEPFAIFGSSGLLEISVNQSSAAHQLGVTARQPLELTPSRLSTGG